MPVSWALSHSNASSGHLVLKVMTNLRHNLWLGHFVGRFHRDSARAAFVVLEPLFEFSLGFAGTEYQD